MADPKNWTCQACGFVGLSDDSDGYFYCDRCGAQAEDLPTYISSTNEKDSEPSEDFEEGHRALTRRD
nr:hypothetical protein CFP56_46161 [Quercus suber]